MEVIEYLLVLARRKMLFLMAIAAVALVGFLASDGWNWSAFIILTALLCAILLFWALVTFWLTVFRGTKRPET